MEIGSSITIVTVLISGIGAIWLYFKQSNDQRFHEIKELHSVTISIIKDENKEKYSLLTDRIQANEVRCKEETDMLMKLWDDTKTELRTYKNEDKAEVYKVVNNLASQIGHLSEVVQNQNDIINKIAE